ncbi:restriction endonuclease [Vibrio vulnificus]|nr:restriction endonuclease [Vibrio vulnificus]
MNNGKLASSLIYTGVSGVGGRSFADQARENKTCIYCGGNLNHTKDITRMMSYMMPITDDEREIARRAGQPIPDSLLEKSSEAEEELIEVLNCSICGWWLACSPYLNSGGHIMEEMGYGQLRLLNPEDIGEPVEAIRSYLAANYQDRFKVHPKKFEEVVASIFRDIGYSTRVTSYTADGGIDVYMDGPDDKLIGVQVKRTKNKIELEQINSLAGALFIKGCIEGVFVTTSEYRRGAVQTAKAATAKGLPIEFYDSKRLLDALQIVQSSKVIDPRDPDAPWMKAAFTTYYKVQ